MKIQVYTFALVSLLAFLCKNSFAQGREIKEVFNSATQSVEVGDSCFIPCLFYVNGGHGLTPETKSACNSIYAFLKQNPTIRIAVMVHSDFRPITMGNDVLTLRRAMRVKEAIIEHGDIDTNRIVAMGMADSMPRTVTEEIHEQYKFLPVGQVLTPEFIKTLISNRQNYEICHSLNRRTVIKIIEK